MTPDEFREYGHQVVEWIAAYYERLESFPVLSPVEPGEIRAALPADPPEHGEGFDGVLHDLDALLMPGITHWQHPSFFAYFPANASGPAILGDLLASGLGVQGMLWATSPAATELETHVLDWLADASRPTDRFRSAGPRARRDPSTPPRTPCSSPCWPRSPGQRRHAPTARASLPSGSPCTRRARPTRRSRKPAASPASARTRCARSMSIRRPGRAPDHLHQLVEADQATGYTPALVVASVGTTGLGAIDPVAELGRIARSAGAWLHVDAAWAGSCSGLP